MPKLTDNFYVQNPGEPLLGLLEAHFEAPSFTTGARHYRLLHIINTYQTQPESADANIHQSTYNNLQVARNFTGACNTVDFVSVQFPEDREHVPEIFRKADDLQRSVLDCGSFQIPRRLPLVFDILENGIAAGQNANYVIFTNTDINLMPYFYDSITRILDYGFDSIVVNRRDLPKFSTNPILIPLMYGDAGAIHPGFDCFVFKAELYQKFIANEACVGAGMVMRGLLYNLAAHAENMLLLRDYHLTYHLGQDATWMSPEFADYTEHNRTNAARVLTALSAEPPARKRLAPFINNSQS